MIGILKYRTSEIAYSNSDATWHTLLTIQCYNETPISQHLFLPIVSMGGEKNKWIKWGATIPDSEGNYYYTSFSAAGYFCPWLFMKIFKLPITEKSLYIFNNVLFAFSAVIMVLLLDSIYEKNIYRKILTILGVIVYIFTPELLHGMGIVYWSQSVMQVTLLLQIYAYYCYTIKGKKAYKYIFYIFAFINPYIEWTGYVANVGFAIAEIILNWKKQRIEVLKKEFYIGIITVLSFSAFCIHYLMRTDAVVFFEVLKRRFMARNVTTDVLLTDVIGGYLSSFLYLWIALLILSI